MKDVVKKVERFSYDLKDAHVKVKREVLLDNSEEIEEPN